MSTRFKNIIIRFKTKAILLSFLILMFNFLCMSTAAFAVSTPSNIDKELSIDELSSISDFENLKIMLSQIYEIETDKYDTDLSDPIRLMYSVTGQTITYYDKFTRTIMYDIVVGIAFLLLTAAFAIKVYEETSAGLEISLASTTMMRKYMKFIIAIVLILNINTIVYFIMSFFRFILSLSIGQVSSDFMGTAESVDGAINSEKVAYEILKQNGVVNTETLLDSVVVRSLESSVKSSSMIPWVFSWISKLTLVVVIVLNSVKLLVHSIFYVVSVSDLFYDLRHSKFMEYTKILFALVLEESIIIVVLYVCSMMLNPYLRKLLVDTVTGTNKMDYLTLAMIFVGTSLVKVFAIISCNKIAQKLMGVM